MDFQFLTNTIATNIYNILTIYLVLISTLQHDEDDNNMLEQSTP